MDDASVNFVSMAEDGDTAEMILEDDSSQPEEPEPILLADDDQGSDETD
jgi:hypothetical protein